MDNEVRITTGDRLLRAWENSMEMVRDFEIYSKEIDDKKIKKVFSKMAEDEGHHAAELRSILLEHQNKEPQN